MRLLPHNPRLGWTPYAWLIYLPIFLADPLSRHTSPLEWTVTGLGVAAFLVLYFVGYWVEGWRLVAVLGAIFGLACGFAPWNPNSAVFIVYAAAFAGHLCKPRWSLAVIAALTVFTGIESWWLQLSIWYWGQGTLFAWIIGGVNIHYTAVGMAAARLKESQEQVQQLARIAERERIARDLHDLLGHTLSVIALKAELAGKLLPGAPERAAVEIADVARVTRDALREVRSAVAGYRSEGLAAELARARLALDAAGLRAEYFTLPMELLPAVEAALALAVREAVTNVIRHAGATVCRITLDRLPSGTLLQIADDGRGGARAAAAGSGLRAMRERLAGLGGQLAIEAGDGDGEGAAGTAAAAERPGTCLTITVPYSGPRAAAAAGAAPAPTPSGGAALAAASRLAPEPGR